MNVYFVRHGLSQLTEATHQLPETPLSDVGHKLAEFSAQRFRNIPVDVILSSTYKRALQTAEEIKKIAAVPLIQSHLLIERNMPSEFLGKPVTDPEIAAIHQSLREHFYEPDWHYADEENFADLLTRAKNAFDLIISQEKETIVVVTHGYFLIIMIFVLLFGENVDGKIFKSFREHITNDNTGITLCEYTNGNWKLVTWNDIAHLREV